MFVYSNYNSFQKLLIFPILTILKTIKESDHSCHHNTLKIFDLIACTFIGLITYGSMRRKIEIKLYLQNVPNGNVYVAMETI